MQNRLKRIGNSDRIGKSDSIGKSDRIGNLDLQLKKVRGRREFFDLVAEYIKNKNIVSEIELNGYFQYITGATDSSIKQALAVLESVGLIECIEEPKPPFEEKYKISEEKMK